MFQTVVVLCIGNICRSPLAMIQLQSQLKAAGSPITVTSAGLGALHNHPAHEIMQKIAEDQQLDLSNHHAKQVTPETIKSADLIFVMTENQKNQVHLEFPQSRGKVFLLHNNPPMDIPDPYQKTEQDFKNAAASIQEGVNQWVKLLSK